MRKIYTIFLFFIINISVLCLNFGIAPTKFEADLSKNTTFEIYLLNNTSNVLRLEAFTEIPQGYENNNLNDSITIYPRKFSIKPGGKKTIYFRVNKKTNTEKKKFKSLIVFREIAPTLVSADKKQNLNIQLNFITEIAVGIYGK